MIGLTVKQRRLLTYLRWYIGTYGEAPTFREMRIALGASSNAHVFRLLNQLQERGVIARTYGKCRSIELLDPPITINGEHYKFIPAIRWAA